MPLGCNFNLNDLRNYDLRNAPICPYGNLKWNRYYWEREQGVPDYEEDYWGKTVDPDGHDRNMLSEEEWRKQVEDIQWIVDIINSRPGGKLLDVGCGPGYFLSAVNAKWEKHGVDMPMSFKVSFRNWIINRIILMWYFLIM
jgi:hypothetical protein